MKIAVIGAGSWGTSLAHLLSEKDHKVVLWGRNASTMEEINEKKENVKYLPGVRLLDRLQCTSDLEEAIKDAIYIIMAVPSQKYRSVVMKMNLQAHQILVNLSKGIEMDTLLTISEITEHLKPGQPFVALSGPSHAEEVSRNIPTTLVAASKSRVYAEGVQDLFTTGSLRVYTNPDLIGVEIGGALKNIIALGAGICDGLGYGDNAKAALMTRGVREISRLGVAMGAKAETFSGLTGIGDLIVTCTSMHSRNRRCGILIGEGNTTEQAIEKIGMVVEGAYTVKSAHALSMRLNVNMPITKELFAVLYEGKDAPSSVKDLMMRAQTHELEEYIGKDSPLMDPWL